MVVGDFIVRLELSNSKHPVYKFGSKLLNGFGISIPIAVHDFCVNTARISLNSPACTVDGCLLSLTCDEDDGSQFND